MSLLARRRINSVHLLNKWQEHALFVYSALLLCRHPCKVFARKEAEIDFALSVALNSVGCSPFRQLKHLLWP